MEKKSGLRDNIGRNKCERKQRYTYIVFAQRVIYVFSVPGPVDGRGWVVLQIRRQIQLYQNCQRNVPEAHSGCNRDQRPERK